VIALAQSAAEVMAAWPSRLGWQRLESRSCGGRHGKLPPGQGPLIYHRRRTDRISEDYRELSWEEDPPLTVVEQVPTSICVTERFYRGNELVNLSDVCARGLGRVFTFDGKFGPGMLIHLNAANGHWIFECTADFCCGGYAAVWRD
jgi:hypothetical protein